MDCGKTIARQSVRDQHRAAGAACPFVPAFSVPSDIESEKLTSGPLGATSATLPMRPPGAGLKRRSVDAERQMLHVLNVRFWPSRSIKRTSPLGRSATCAAPASGRSPGTQRGMAWERTLERFEMVIRGPFRPLMTAALGERTSECAAGRPGAAPCPCVADTPVRPLRWQSRRLCRPGSTHQGLAGGSPSRSMCQDVQATSMGATMTR